MGSDGAAASFLVQTPDGGECSASHPNLLKPGNVPAVTT